MRWKPILKVAELNVIIKEYVDKDMKSPDIVTAINNKYRKEYKINIVQLFRLIHKQQGI